jgi:hypothetical protein
MMKKASLLLLAFAAAPLVSAGVIINDAPAPVAAGSSSPNGMCASTDDQAVCAALTDLYKDTVSKSITQTNLRLALTAPCLRNRTALAGERTPAGSTATPTAAAGTGSSAAKLAK